MAPAKSTRGVAKHAHSTSIQPTARKPLARHAAQNIQNQNTNVDAVQTRGKRKAENSPIKNEKVKRSALGNLTNNTKLPMTNIGKQLEGDVKQQNAMKDPNIFCQTLHANIQILRESQNAGDKTGPTTRQQNKITTRATSKNAIHSQILEDQHPKKTNALSNVVEVSAAKSKREHMVAPKVLAPKVAPEPAPPPASLGIKAQSKPKRRISNDFNKTEESLYMSALEDVSSCESMRLSGNFEAAKRRSALLLEQVKSKTEDQHASFSKISDIPEGIEDFDKANWLDPFQVPNYAMDIFNYLREREADFVIHDYMTKQGHLTKAMRSLLVDWMVEVQETFELNHETLYLAVKIVDLYLCRVFINKDKLQLLGAAALFIACKYDERTPPLIEDFLYICDGAYKHDELIQMEMATLRTIDYDLGIPLSYRFLRRYARCAKVSMPTLTLARYILELSLMDYDTIRFSDSKLASATLYMALRMHGDPMPWTTTLEYYSSYKLIEFADIIPVLNAGLHRKPKGTIKTIRSKYSHKIFHEVAKVPLLTTQELFENNLDLNESV